jgi:glycogen phosphorylase
MTVRLPAPLSPLGSLAYDLWWTWHSDAKALFKDADPEGWQRSGHNPVVMLQEISYARAMDLSEDPAYQSRLAAVVERWKVETADPDPEQSPVPGASPKRPVAYFCMEYGIHMSLPIYSGGLGVLAGDHLKSASDLGIPLVAVGMFYREGYFHQKIENSDQVEQYERIDPRRLPMVPVIRDGSPVIVEVPDNHGTYPAQIWEVKVGRVKLFLLDANVPGATWWRQQYTRRLYGGNNDTRIAQEVLLGIGGVRALRTLGYDPVTYHINEGHAAFLTMELVREGMVRGLSPTDAVHQARQQCVFTTHTPVLAGHDRFTWDQVQATLVGFWESVGLPRGFIMDMGRVWPGDVGAPTCMTILALRMTRAANAVSKLHETVTRRMWSELYAEQHLPHVGGIVYPPRPPVIGHITNGVHPPTWAAPSFIDLLDRYTPGWDQAWRNPRAWEAATREIPAEALWDAHRKARHVLLEWLAKQGLGRLNPEALIIGFARRFAPYKRGNLLFQDLDRLEALLESGPVQIVFSGKSHPADLRGHAIITEVLDIAADPRFRGRILFIPDYDIRVGQYLVRGCDLWLNTPRKPHEASGTSGQKAALQGVLNLSILDGWWPEAWDGTNGWAIQSGRDSDVVQDQDVADAVALYHLLEDEVIPTWKERDEYGMPTRWVERMRRSIATCLPAFDSRRMVSDYARMYVP